MTVSSNGNVLMTTSILILEDIVLNDEGDYICVASSDLYDVGVEELIQTIIVTG